MTVELSGAEIRVSGAARIEDAERLLALLQADGARVVDLTGAEVLHTAVVQVLLAFRPRLTGLPEDSFFKTWLMPGLAGHPGDRATNFNGPAPPSEQT